MDGSAGAIIPQILVLENKKKQLEKSGFKPYILKCIRLLTSVLRYKLNSTHL